MFSQATISAVLGQSNLDNYLGWYIAGAIIIIGLLGVGFKDLLRFSPKRIWAISGVCFAESIRRRVLWITPLAILGVIIVAQLQRPVDEQDAVRQTLKFCLFATGLLVTTATIILACTNLPKEIENRVIYTVVTKPTTRLEIVLGKIVGFARVSAAILLIMGLFSYAYLHVRAWSLRNDIQLRLDLGAVNATSVPTLKHYAEAGLLSARRFHQPPPVQILSREPKDGDPQRWVSGGGEQEIVVPFDIQPADLLPPGGGDSSADFGVTIVANLLYEQHGSAGPVAEPEPSTQPTLPVMGPVPVPAMPPRASPQVSFEILGADQYSLIPPEAIGGGKPLSLPPSGSGRLVEAPIAPDGAGFLARRDPVHPESARRIYVTITGVTSNTEFGINTEPKDKPPVYLVVTGNPAGNFRRIVPSPEPVVFYGRRGKFGQQLRGASAAAPVAIFQFRDAPMAEQAGQVPFELRLGIERGLVDPTVEEEQNTQVSLRVRNGDKVFGPFPLTPESNRTAYFNLPAEAVAGGNFDVLMQCFTDGHWLGFAPQSLMMVSREENFGVNLLKSLMILWLLSLLVVIISIFCSTFLSWPIAVVLTVVLLLGHWGVDQLRDTMTPGLGRQLVTQMMPEATAPTAALVSRSVEALNLMLSRISVVLPDISRFSATEDIEKGIAIPLTRLLAALQVIGGFGIPMMVLAYVFLKKKEVAP